jgi:CheY-like chemotaxis protein
MNLCTNARDAMPSGGELRIEAKQEEDDAVVSVSDTGHGMDKATCERCFDPFYTTKGIGKGTGLGLSTSYGIVRDHGGDIHVHSEVGQGTTFHVYLPIAPGHKGRIEEKSDRVIHGKGEKVLIVDDEADIREPIEYMLTRLGYRVHSAGSGSEAIDSYWSWQPDVVLLDRNMPGMDGLTCAHKILEADPEDKILFVSGYGQNDPDGVNGHMSKLIKGYLTKPINIQELSQALNRLFSE